MIKSFIDFQEILNGKRDYDFYEGDPILQETLESVEYSAKQGLYNGPEGNAMILRLLEIIKAQLEN